MSTHSTQLWLATQLGPGPGGGVAEIDVASDVSVDQCARIAITGSRGNSLSHGPRDEAEIHLNPEQTELVGRALLAIAADLRARGVDSEAAGRTVELYDSGLRSLESHGDEPVDEHVELRHQIIQNGPYVDGHADMFGGRTPTWQEANDLRRDLLDLAILREQAETCTCGHGLLHEMFHLMPCPIAARRIARRKASMLTEEDA